MADDGSIRSGLKPMHPGELLREVVLPALKEDGVTRARFAELVGLSRSRFYDLLDGKSAVTAELALKLGRLCGNGPDLWLNLQQAWDLAQARAALGDVLEALPVLNEMGSLEFVETLLPGQVASEDPRQRIIKEGLEAMLRVLEAQQIRAAEVQRAAAAALVKQIAELIQQGGGAGKVAVVELEAFQRPSKPR